MVILLAGSVLSFLRVPNSGRDTLWAEDGSVFVGAWLHGASSTVLFRPYGGYQHLLPRLISRLVTGVLPVAWWARGMTIGACVLVGAIAALVYVVSRDVVESPAARWGLAAIPVLSPLASIEAVGNMANLHWYLLYLTPWLLLAIPRSKLTAWALGCVALFAALTEPQCLLFAPLALIVLSRGRAALPVLWGWLLGSAGQAATLLTASRPRHAGVPPFASAVKGYLINVSMSNGAAHHRVLARIFAALGWWPAITSLAIFSMVATFASWRAKSIARVAVANVLCVSVVSWFLAFYLNNSSQYFYRDLRVHRLVNVPLVRWGTGAAMLLGAVVPLAVGRLIELRPRAWPLGVVAVVAMISVMCFSFTSTDNLRGGEPWNQAVKNAKVQCRVIGGATADVPTTPQRWSVPMPCARLS